jgi:hypothetical protein
MESRGRLLLQPRPAGVAPIPLGRRTAEGLPFDVLMALESIRQLAEQGNVVARTLYEMERERLGLDRPAIFMR